MPKVQLRLMGRKQCHADLLPLAGTPTTSPPLFNTKFDTKLDTKLRPHMGELLVERGFEMK
ncbi:hypothetical protein RSO68_08300 [Halomonas saccharevitans]|uniref:Uncharacterized protein n=1 Tax=Halomonas saccharevitans TaxID=416872 RepID=A0ABU3NEK1_9GAMM|nr:hypothetical protein [Halomonas saccharevitans]MDT8879467.1 hypothetical protein [Halomonas saccharevitans]